MSLLDLASAITGPQSATTKRYAQAQAQAFSDLAAQVAALAIPPPTPPPPPVPPADVPHAQRDYGGDVQKMVDEMPDGSCAVIDLMATLKEPLDLSAKNAIRLSGAGGVGFNDGGRWGCGLNQTTKGVPVVNVDGGGTVKHAGPTLEYLNLIGGAADVTGLRIRQCNHGELRRCAFQGTFSAGIDMDVPTTTYDQGDCAYWDFEKFTVSNRQPNAIGLVMGDGYARLRGGNFDLDGNQPRGVVIARGAVQAIETKWNHAGQAFYTEGASSVVMCCSFEIGAPSGPFTDYPYAVEVAVAASDPLPGSGRRNVFVANSYNSHPYPARLCKFGVGTGGNVFDLSPAYNNDAQSVLDLSPGNNFVRAL